MNGLEQRFRDQRPILGLPASFCGRRWVASDGGPDNLTLAHGEPRPDSSPLIVVGVMRTRSGNGWVDVHDTLGTMLMLAERARNDPAFQHATRDRAAIELELSRVPGPEAWRSSELEVDGVARPAWRLERGGDWIAFCDLGDECLYLHAEQPDGSPLSLVTITDTAQYERGGVS